jgi:Zn-dependent protease
VIVAATLFLLLMIHELGHTFAFRYFGQESSIVLYWMGGLAVPNHASWNSRRARIDSPNNQIIISGAGPAAGLVVGGIMVLLVYAIGGNVNWSFDGVFPIASVVAPNAKSSFNNPALMLFFEAGIYLATFWNILNLLPIWPLDGGQISRALFLKSRSPNGIPQSLMLSCGTAVVIAVWSIQRGGVGFTTIFFGLLAFESYNMLTSYSGRGPFGGGGWR